MDDMEEEKRGIDDLIFPRKKNLTDLWRREWERKFRKNEQTLYILTAFDINSYLC
jgi:hypothetical protein